MGATEGSDPIDREVIGVTASDGHQSDLLVFPGRGRGPVILIMPAMGVRAAFYQVTARQLAAAGYGTAVGELRGHGSSSLKPSRRVNFGYADMIDKDWPALMTAVATRFPDRPIYLLGHSLGGQLSALYLAANPQQGAGLILVASANVHYRGWPHVVGFGLLAATQVAPLLSTLVGHFPGPQVGFGGREARGVIVDWARNARTGGYRVDGLEHDFETLTGRRDLSVLALTFAADRFAPYRACANLYGKFKAGRVTHHHLKRDQTDGLDLDHFSWARQPESVVRYVDGWLSG